MRHRRSRCIGAPGIRETGKVEARDGLRFSRSVPLVCEASQHGFLGGVPRLSAHDFAPLLAGATSTLCVSICVGIRQLVEQVCGFTHRRRIAPRHTSRVMNHELRACVHRQMIGSHHDQRCGRCCDTVNEAVDGRIVASQCVVDRDPIPSGAARGVHVKVDRLNLECGQHRRKLASRGSPIGDLVVDVHVSRIALGPHVDALPITARHGRGRHLLPFEVEAGPAGRSCAGRPYVSRK